MDIIGIYAQKGGVGKTHLGTNWAVEAERSGIGCVAILDLDPQGTAASWSQRRLDYQDRDTSIMLRAGVDQLEDVLYACGREGVDLLLVDTNPGVERPVTATGTGRRSRSHPLRPLDCGHGEHRAHDSDRQKREAAKLHSPQPGPAGLPDQQRSGHHAGGLRSSCLPHPDYEAGRNYGRFRGRTCGVRTGSSRKGCRRDCGLMAVDCQTSPRS